MRKLKLFLSLLMVMFLSIGQMWATDYQLVTSTSDLEAGAKYVIGSAASGSGVFMSTESRNNNRGVTSSITISDSKITGTDGLLVLELGGSTGAWTFLTKNYSGTDGYLGCGTGNKDNHCKINATVTDYCKFTISISNNKAVITSTGRTDRNIMRYNSSNNPPIFACYSSGQNDIYLYKEVTGGDEPTACATPTFSPAAGTYASAQNVTISCATQDATIYYTTDGSEPTTASSTYTSAIPVSANTTIKAFAVKSGLENSSVASATYTIVSIEHAGSESDPYTVADARNAIAVGGDLSNKYVAGIISQVDSYNSNYSSITYWISDDGETTSPQLEVYSGKGLNGANFSAVTDLHVADEVTVKGTLKLYGEIYEFDKNNQLVSFNRPGSATPCATPTFSPAAGTYTEVQTVSISCETEGATIYYTTDGTNPTNESTVYSAAISVGENMTIKAIAMKEGMANSFVATAAYTINLPEDENVQKTWNLSIDETETASGDKLTWTATYVDMSFAKGTSTTDANNYYPGKSGQSYTSTRTYKNSVITITPNGKEITSIVFTATTQGYGTALKNSTWSNASATSDAAVVTVTPENGTQAISATIGATCGFTAVCVHYKNPDATKPADPTFSPAAGTYTEVQTVSISCETEGATIYYTTDGTTPTSASTEYAASISVGEDMTIKAIAIKDDKQSNVVSAAYTINLPVSEEDQKTWDLTKDEMASASADELTWTATYVDMSITRGTSTDANNYCPPDHEETRVYTGATLTISPKGKQITTIVFETNGSTPFKNATWTNGAFSNDGNTVTITASAPGNVEAVFGANTRIYSVQVNYGPIDTSIPEAPTFSPAAGTYTSAQSVELACATEGATIYYTTDGTTPTSESTEYTAAISVGENMTIKAIAINNDKVSSVATANYVINLPLSTMDQIFAAATAASSTATDANIQFNNWVVSGVSMNGKNVFVTDGTKGFIIFDNGGEMGFAAGDVLSGTVACKVQLYKGAAELTTLSSTTEGLNIAKEGVITPVVKAISALSGINTGAPVTINSVQFDGTNLSDGVNSIKPFNSLFAYDALENSKYYNVTGIYQQFDATKEILPRSAADIDEVDLDDPEISYTPASATIELGQSLPGTTFANPHELAISYSSNNEAVATVTDAGVISLAGGLGTAVITASFAGNATYAAANVTYTITVNPASVSENVVILAVYDTKYYAMSTTNANSAFTAIEVEYDGSKVTVNSEADKTAIQWTKKTSGENTSFQTKDETPMYMKGTSSGAAMSLNASVCNWSWDVTNEYYYIGSRSFFYQAAGGYFKNFSISDNMGKTGYSDKAQVIVIAPEDIVISSKVDPALAYTPASDEITVGDAWSAPVLGYVEGFDGLAAITYESSNEAVATVTDAGVIALAGGTGTATITAMFGGNASYLAGSATYTVKVNEPAEDCDGTDDFLDTEDKGNPTSYKDRSTPNGWTAVNAGYKVIDEKAYWMINGKTTAVGVITSPELSDGIATLKFRYANTNSESNGVSVKIEIKQGGDVVKEYTLTKPNSEVVQNTVYTELIENINVAGTFQIVITNLSPSNNTGNKDRVSIGRFCWSSYDGPTDFGSYHRTVTNGNYGTICLPQAGTIEGATLFEIGSYENNIIYVDEVLSGELEAGKPYIFQATADQLNVTYTSDTQVAASNANGLHGFYNLSNMATDEADKFDITEDAGNYILYQNAYWLVSGRAAYINNFRAYIKIGEINAQAPAPGRRRVAMAVHGEQVATGVENVQGDNVQCTKVLINGQLFILRGEKMYDAKGQLVK